MKRNTIYIVKVTLTSARAERVEVSVTLTAMTLRMRY